MHFRTGLEATISVFILIPNITLQNLQDENYFKEIISKNKYHNYFWSDDWSEAFYIKQAQRGFISTTHDTGEALILLPELQFDYSILDFKNLHISKKVQKLLKKEDVELQFNTRFNEVLERFAQEHKNNWLKNEYALLMQSLHTNRALYDNFEIISVELISKKNNYMIAGEIGYSIGSTYTSLSGFSSKEKMYNNYGTLQLVLLARYLENAGFSFWNLGHPYMQYKTKLGSLSYTRKDFLQRWNKDIKNEMIIIHSTFAHKT